MRIKQHRFDSETKRLFDFENLLEGLYTKNVIELSVLHSGRKICLDGTGEESG